MTRSTKSQISLADVKFLANEFDRYIAMRDDIMLGLKAAFRTGGCT